MIFATIDIGTNSVLLLIGEIAPDGCVSAIKDLMAVTRLGEGLSRSGAISDAAASRTLNQLSEYKSICDAHGVLKISAIGTAALRSASNAAAFLSAARERLGAEVEVISGDREAELAFSAASRDFGNEIVVMDIGGGSTEFIARDKEGRLSCKSLPIGCVSLTERFITAVPEKNDEIFHMRHEIHTCLDGGLAPGLFSRPHDRALVATAGTATTLCAMHLGLSEYDPLRVHGYQLKIDSVRDLIDLLRTRTLEERKQMPGLAPGRADVIRAGAEILQESMSFLGYCSAAISDRGIRWGLFYEKFAK